MTVRRAMSADPPELAAVGISRRGRADRLLLDAVDLQVAAGDRVAVSGPSGSGKSMLLRALALLDPFDSGDVLWRGSPVSDAEVPAFRSRVTYHQQAPAVVEGTVRENLRRPFDLAAHSGRHYDDGVAERLLGDLGRGGELLEALAADLSGGERQIVAVVRLLMLEPQILLLDEPTAALDPATEDRVIETVTEWAGERQDRSYVWVTHDVRLAPRLANRALVVVEGRVREESVGGG